MEMLVRVERDQRLKGTEVGAPTTRAPKLLGEEYSLQPIELWALTQATISSPTSRSRVDWTRLIEKAQEVVTREAVPLQRDSNSSQLPLTLNSTS